LSAAKAGAERRARSLPSVRNGIVAVALGGGATALLVAAVDRVGTRRLMLTPAERAFDMRHGTWRHMFEPGALQAHAPLALWAIALAVLGLVGLPYVYVACAGLPDRGVALARPVSLLLVGWTTWWLVSLRLTEFSRAAIAAALALVTLGGLLLLVGRRHDLGAWVRGHWRLVVVEEAVFWGLFGAATLVRYLNPDLWHPFRGGEKPMDLAYLDAVIKSAHFPPYDPWFASGQLNYYYYGFILVAVIVKGTGIEPAVAYNLAVPTFFAMLGAVSFTATLALIPGGRDRVRGRARVYAAAVGVALVAVLGNLGEVRVLATRVHGQVPLDWWFWNASRLIHHPAGEAGPINEFPAFTYLYADLHAHAIALPFDAAALALSLAVVRAAGGESPTARRTRFFLLALVIGALWAINSWDVPVFACVALVALAGAHAPRRDPWSSKGIAYFIAQAVGLVALAYALFLPFHLRYRSVYVGVAPWHGSRTPLDDYLTIYGLFMFAFLSAFLVELWTSPNLNAVVRSIRLQLKTWDRVRRRRELMQVLVGKRSLVFRTALPGWATAILVLAVLGQSVAAVALFLAGLAASTLAKRRRGAAPDRTLALRRFTIFLFLLALALTVSVEYLVVAKIDVGRVNTLFKIYLQVWLIWGVAAAAAIAFVYGRLPLLPREVRVAWRGALICLLTAAALYPALAVPARINDRFDTSVGPTLNGEAFMTRAVFQAHDLKFRLAWDGQAIDWIQTHLDGSPVVAEVNTDPALYAWGNRYAMFTGNPSIVGWDYHQRQQRPWQTAEIRRRIADVQRAYRTTDAARAYQLFARYEVAYIVVGPLERAYFPAGTAKWTRGEGRFWTLVYSNPGVQLYRMRPVS
jgi:YYY domain-containing protein